MRHIHNIKEKPSLIPQIAQWIYEQWGQYGSRSFDQIQIAIQDQNNLDYPFTLVAVENEEPVGTASLKAHDMDILQHLTPWLSGVYVPPAHRGKGIASSLIQEVVQRARNLGFEQLYLFTDSGVPLYKKLGWSPVQELQYHGLDVVVMDRKLTEET